jgi:hypothetical protein
MEVIEKKKRAVKAAASVMRWNAPTVARRTFNFARDDRKTDTQAKALASSSFRQVGSHTAS